MYLVTILSKKLIWPSEVTKDKFCNSDRLTPNFAHRPTPTWETCIRLPFWVKNWFDQQRSTKVNMHYQPIGLEFFTTTDLYLRNMILLTFWINCMAWPSDVTKGQLRWNIKLNSNFAVLQSSLVKHDLGYTWLDLQRPLNVNIAEISNLAQILNSYRLWRLEQC